jgi:hypothetical protein
MENNSSISTVNLFDCNTAITKCTGVEQNNGKTTDTVHISLLIWCWTTYAFNTAAVLFGMDSYKF